MSDTVKDGTVSLIYGGWGTESASWMINMVPETPSRDVSSSSLLEGSHAIQFHQEWYVARVSLGVAVSMSPGVVSRVSLLAVGGFNCMHIIIEECVGQLNDTSNM